MIARRPCSEVSIEGGGPFVRESARLSRKGSGKRRGFTVGTVLAVLATALCALAVLGGLILLGTWLAVDAAKLAKENPKTWALWEQRRDEAASEKRPFRPRWRWVRFEEISVHLVNAVVLSEDASFFVHHGFDWDELEDAARTNLEKKAYVRGASTITQQVAKNLFLGTRKSLLRKAEEAVVAVKLERGLSKRRILTLYLNVAEWGDQVFGAEAGAEARFGTSARSLTPAQAAVMAALLPAPRKFDLKRPTQGLKKRARRVADLLHETKRIDDRQYEDAVDDLDELLAGAGSGEGTDEEGFFERIFR